MMNTRHALALATAGFLAVSCVSNDKAKDGLVIGDTQQGIEGSFTSEQGDVEFTSSALSATVNEVVLKFNDMTFVYTYDKSEGVLVMDGFATANGEQTQMTAADRALMKVFTQAVDELKITEGVYDAMSNAGAILTEFPGTLDLRRMVAGKKDRGWTSLCAYRNQYVQASHDGWSTKGDCGWWGCDFGDDASTLYAYVSSHSTQCNDAYDGTKTWTGSSWNNCYEYDHTTTYEYQYGNCFGNCGGGCQGSGDEFTLDCHNHDQCVRGGHGIADLSCDDQFISTIDDEAGAPSC